MDTGGTRSCCWWWHNTGRKQPCTSRATCSRSQPSPPHSLSSHITPSAPFVSLPPCLQCALKPVCDGHAWPTSLHAQANGKVQHVLHTTGSPSATIFPGTSVCFEPWRGVSPLAFCGPSHHRQDPRRSSITSFSLPTRLWSVPWQVQASSSSSPPAWHAVFAALRRRSGTSLLGLSWCSRCGCNACAGATGAQPLRRHGLVSTRRTGRAPLLPF